MLRIASEIVSVGSGAEFDYVHELFQHDYGHATPKVDVRVAVFQGNSLLFVRERSTGGWSLPGGWADPGETPSESAVREMLEESGYRVRATRLLAAYDRDRQGHIPAPFYALKLFFECEIIAQDKPTQHTEIDDVAFFPRDRLPELDPGRITQYEIERIFEHHENPGLPADFD